ncbi:MAG: FemAB family PEP-CTERM system-associated protein [Alphaproteobacteria bacterium]|nr:FemAB family PEP-CTERM system-associated protein [Alphaproteobacteria bacterium]
MLLPDTPAASAEWDDYAASRPDANFFQLSGWREVVKRSFGHACPYLAARRADGKISGILPLTEIDSRLFGHFLISTGFSVGGGPLASDPSALAELLGEAEELGRARKVAYVELRDCAEAGQAWKAKGDLYAGFEGPIAREEADNLKQIPRKQRAVVRKALEQGFTVAIERTIQPFFDLYARTLRDHGTPILPRRFYENLLTVFGNACEILTVRKDGVPTASVMSFYYRDKVLPYYTGSLVEARRSGANDMMYWALMRRAVERGATVFDFGRSKVGTGPYSFKSNWGFSPRPITHQYLLIGRDTLPNLNPTNPRYAKIIAAWQRLPIPVANAISPFISRSLA